MTAHHARAEYAAINRADPTHIPPTTNAIAAHLEAQAIRDGQALLAEGDVAGAFEVVASCAETVQKLMEAAK